MPNLLQMTSLYSGTVTGAPVAAYCGKVRFGALLGEVFLLSFPCASHRPAAFCRFPLEVLVLVIAFVVAAII